VRARALPLLGDVCAALQLPGEAAVPQPHLRIHCPPLAQWVATTLRQWAAAGDDAPKTKEKAASEHVELPVVWAELRCVSYAGLDAAAVRQLASCVLQRAHRLTDACCSSDPALLLLAAEAMAVVTRSWGAQAAVGDVAAAVPAALQRVTEHPTAVPLLTAAADLLDAVCHRHPTSSSARACVVLREELTPSGQSPDGNKASGDTPAKRSKKKAAVAGEIPDRQPPCSPPSST